MSSEGNKINDGTSFQPSDPALCANGCGFFGTAATMNLCSKCFRDLRIKEEQTAKAKAAMDKFVNPTKSSVVDGFSMEINVGSPSSSDSDSGPVVEAAKPSAESCYGGDQKLSNRCSSCRKKVGVLGFNCRCGCTFCGVHRYPEKHECTFDFKAIGRESIAKANPVVKADKIVRF